MKLDSDLSALMEKALVARADSGPNADPPKEKRVKPRASSAAGLCERELVYYLIGADKLPMNVEGAGAVDAGKALEAGILDDLHFALCAEAGEELPYQDQVRIDLPWVTGSADRYYPTIQTVVDSKTGNKAAFAIKGREGFEGDSYEVQLSIYGHALGAKDLIIAMRGVGTQKGDGSYIVQRLPVNMEKVKEAQAMCERAIAAASSGTLPAPTFPKSHWKCRGYCSYRHVCPNEGS